MTRVDRRTVYVVEGPDSYSVHLRRDCPQLQIRDLRRIRRDRPRWRLLTMAIEVSQLKDRHLYARVDGPKWAGPEGWRPVCGVCERQERTGDFFPPRS